MDDPNSCKFRLVAAFLAMEPIHVLLDIARELGGGSITEEVQSIFYEECINNEICRNYPPSEVYIKNLVKQIITYVESQFHEVLDVFYELYTKYVAYGKDCGLSPSIGKCYRNLMFIFPTTSNLHLASHGNQHIRDRVILTVSLRSSLNMLEGGTGCCIWPSSLFLSEFILSHQQLFSSKCCFEVGSGAGLVGICLANVKASKVILTDGDLSALANLKHNLEINHIPDMRKTGEETCPESGLVEYRHLKWESASVDDLQNCRAEVILGADVIYDISCVPHLVRVLAALLQTKKGPSKSRNKISDLKQSTTISENSLIEGMIEHYNTDSNRNINEDSGVFCTNAHPVAYIAAVVRNIDTFNCFRRLAFEAGLSVMDITKAMSSVSLLPYLSSFERSSVHLYRISSLEL